MITLKEKEEKFIAIFVVFSQIERMIEMVLDGHSIKFNKLSFGDKVSKFILYLERRPNKRVNTSAKIFHDNKLSLEDVLRKIQSLRNIVAHEVAYLIYDTIEEMPITVPGLRLQRKKYKGRLDELYLEFMQHANIIFPLYERVSQIGYKAFESFDINGKQIGQY